MYLRNPPLDGQDFGLGTATEGGVEAPITGRFSDLEQYTIEGGFRKYAGGLNNRITGLRPYIGATAHLMAVPAELKRVSLSMVAGHQQRQV